MHPTFACPFRAVCDTIPVAIEPVLMLYGDNVKNHPRWPKIRQGGVDYAETLQKGGGNVDVYDLPDMGLKSNSHMIMMHKDSDEVAGLIQKWLAGRGWWIDGETGALNGARPSEPRRPLARCRADAYVQAAPDSAGFARVNAEQAVNSRFSQVILVAIAILLGLFVVQPYVDRALFSATTPRPVEARGQLSDFERATIEVFDRVSPSVVQVVGRSEEHTSELQSLRH